MSLIPFQPQLYTSSVLPLLSLVVVKIRDVISLVLAKNARVLVVVCHSPTNVGRSMHIYQFYHFIHLYMCCLLVQTLVYLHTYIPTCVSLPHPRCYLKENNTQDTTQNQHQTKLWYRRPQGGYSTPWRPLHGDHRGRDHLQLSLSISQVNGCSRTHTHTHTDNNIDFLSVYVCANCIAT